MLVASEVGTIPNLGTLGLRVLELFAMYATDGRMDKSKAYCPLPYGRGHNKGIHIHCLGVSECKRMIIIGGQYIIVATYTRRT